MKAVRTGTIEKSPENVKWFDRRGYHMTGETLTIRDDYYGDEYATETTFVVFKGRWTRYKTVRDCGDHYIYAGYSSHIRIEKDTLEITFDVDDV